MSEWWDLYDVHLKLTGLQHLRGRPVPRGFFHMAVHVHLYNDKGEFLMQKRAAGKARWPGAWLMVGGSALAGEDGVAAAQREVAEELGLHVPAEDLELLFIERREHSFVKVFAAKTHARLCDCRLEPTEVEAVCYMPAAQALSCMRQVGWYPAHLYAPVETLVVKMKLEAGNWRSASNE